MRKAMKSNTYVGDGPHRLWSPEGPATSLRQRRNKKRGAGSLPAPLAASRREVHVELDRMRRHAEALHFLVLEGDVRIDHVVGEDAAAREELAVLVERLERLVERGAR